jgi:hypothetical protein
VGWFVEYGLELFIDYINSFFVEARKTKVSLRHSHRVDNITLILSLMGLPLVVYEPMVLGTHGI